MYNRLAASVFASNFLELKDNIKKIEKLPIDELHLDVMDGHFVPNMGFSYKAINEIDKITNLFLDVHLMIYDPFKYVDQFITAGANRITFHIEATEDADDLIKYIKAKNVQVGIAFNPETSVEMIMKFMYDVDLILVMGVSPGFSGQKFEEINSITKLALIKQLKKKLMQKKLINSLDIQIDGGMTLEIAKKCIKAGANNIVLGSYLFPLKDSTYDNIIQLKDYL